MTNKYTYRPKGKIINEEEADAQIETTAKTNRYKEKEQKKKKKKRTADTNI